VYRRYVGEVVPSLRRARRELDQLLRMNLGEPLAAHGELLAGTAGLTVERDQALYDLGRGTGDSGAYMKRFGAYAPAWDVAVPPDDEAPDRVREHAARLAALPRSPRELHAEAESRADHAASALLERIDRMGRRAFKALLPRVREVLPIAEDDDALFFRAQRAVRRALLVRGGQLCDAGRLDRADAVFDLPLAALSDKAADLRALANHHAAERRAAAARVPPIAIDDGRPRYAPPAAKGVLRGFATAGTARGRAVIVRASPDTPHSLAAGSILIVPAILPSLTHLLPGAAALVTDHGGAHSHGATLAREYGIPAVLGTRSATTLAPGTDLLVDADLGRVYVL
jgi:pyruvate,water dikinase